MARLDSSPARLFVSARCAKRLVSTVLLSLLVSLALLSAQARAADALEVMITYVSSDEKPPVPLSLIDERIENDGRSGAQLGLQDNQTTGSFLGQEYALSDVMISEGQSIAAAMSAANVDAPEIVIANLRAEPLLSLADTYPDALILNIRAAEDSLRNEQCRANVFHIPPSRAMLTDGLAQYLAWKRWREVALITGRHPEDVLYSDALKRAGKRFGLKFVEDKAWTSVPGARRTDSGHHAAQTEIPAFTQFDDHDVVLVADERDEFGEYLQYRTSNPRPVAGTQGLLPTSWHRSHEQWGATQIQRRFDALAGRDMSERDYSAWAAMRALGEAVTNTSTSDPVELRKFLLSDRFKLAGFKGLPLTFRSWNGQLRQPVLLVAPRMLVSVSPQDGFLHPNSELDTLGYDEPETGCVVFSEN